MLSPQNHAIALIDFQPAMCQGVQSYDRLVTFNKVQVLTKGAAPHAVYVPRKGEVNAGAMSFL
jgi:hypothetical protein